MNSHGNVGALLSSWRRRRESSCAGIRSLEMALEKASLNNTFYFSSRESLQFQLTRRAPSKSPVCCHCQRSDMTSQVELWRSKRYATCTRTKARFFPTHRSTEEKPPIPTLPGTGTLAGGHRRFYSNSSEEG